MPRIRAELVERYPQFFRVFKWEGKIESWVLVRSRPANRAAKMNLDLLKRLRSMPRSADGVTTGKGCSEGSSVRAALQNNRQFHCKSRRPPRLQERQHKARWRF
jgi:hypothetical protein